jgi:GNAT superfamily N-acetyltransferase
MRIGRLGIADAAQFDESRRAYAVELGGSGEADVAFTRRLLKDPGVRVWGAIEGSALIGFAVVTEPPDAIHGTITGMMDDLFVAPAWRRCGIARAILAAIGAHAKAEGWSHVRWLVHEGDAAAIALYDKIAEQVALRSYVIRLDAPGSLLFRVQISDARSAQRHPPPSRGRVGGGRGGSAWRSLRWREQPPPRPSPNLGEGNYSW